MSGADRPRFGAKHGELTVTVTFMGKTGKVGLADMLDSLEELDEALTKIQSHGLHHDTRAYRDDSETLREVERT